VRDKVAASRRKGKWTGSTVPLGYEAKNKKLVINPKEAETVRVIFKQYLALKSFSLLVQDLDRRGIITKRRDTKVPKYRGGIPFTYGPLAHVLKNRVYLGEVHHGGKWYPAEHKPILDQKVFDQVQTLLAANRVTTRTRQSASGALLAGKLRDDRGNYMSPSFTVKNGIRYRFYISRALMRGRKAQAGSIARIPAQLIESLVINAGITSHLTRRFPTISSDAMSWIPLLTSPFTRRTSRSAYSQTTQTRSISRGKRR
jgi:hypothetical protein